MNDSAPDTVRWWGHSDRGKIRQHNEDAFLGLQFNAQESQYLGKEGETTLASYDAVFAVSDGMGGASAGEFASKIAVEKITRLLPRSFKQAAQGLQTGRADVLSELFEQIHKALLFLGNSYEDCSGMGATLTLCWLTPGWLFYGHIGDSRLYYLPSGTGTLRQLSEDDTYVGWLRRTGQISEFEARNHPGRNSLQKALGAGHQFVEPQVGAVGYERGDIFLLASDGLTDGLFDNRIEEALHQVNRATALGANPATQLVADSVRDSGRDNTTALIITLN
jgi:PPM family protein phosphatase